MKTDLHQVVVAMSPGTLAEGRGVAAVLMSEEDEEDGFAVGIGPAECRALAHKLLELAREYDARHPEAAS